MTEHTIVDLRVYTIRPRKVAEFIEVFDSLAMPIQLRYLEPPLGMFMSAVGPLNQIVHLWGFPDMGEFERRNASRDKDPDWPAYLQASEHLIVAQENRLIRRIELRSLRGLGS